MLFRSGTAAYGEDTPQAPQVILKGQKAVRPADPSKEGYKFRQWVTADNGSEPFHFNAGITQKSEIYASWISETADVHTIKATAGEGGSISPEGDVPVEDGGEQVFGIIPDSGWQVKAVMVDGRDHTGALTGGLAASGRYYTFPDVREDHTIHVTFEETEVSRRVTVKVRKDGTEWQGNGRKFMLLAEDGTLTDNFEKASPGNYVIYDVTGAAGDSLLTDGVDTGILVSVADGDVEVAVDYYTVTFYDSGTAYADGTPQAPQIILKGKKAVRPADPSKEGYKFRQWATEDNGNKAFNFNVPVERKGNAYAVWISETAEVHRIKATAGEGGSISPEGEVLAEDGSEQVFEIIPEEGWQVKAVMVDGEDRTDGLTDGATVRATGTRQAGTIPSRT